MILPTSYLAPRSWYCAYLAEQCEIEVYESFQKQTLRNRAVIAGTNGKQTLTVPVLRSESKQWTRDVRISYQTKWQHQHWMALVSAYRHTPFFQYLADIFEPIYHRRYDYLIDLNRDLHLVIMQCLMIDDHSHYQLTDTWHQDTDIDRYFTPAEGNTQRPYYQIFQDKHGFQPNLSIVDLLFNLGPEAIRELTIDK